MFTSVPLVANPIKVSTSKLLEYSSEKSCFLPLSGFWKNTLVMIEERYARFN